MARTAHHPSPTVEGSDAAAIVAIGFAVLLPLAVNPWGFQQRMPIAWWLVLLAVPLGLGLTVRATGGVFETRTTRWWLALLGVLALATATSVAPLNALIGSPARHLGLIGWVVLALACWWGVHLGQRAGVATVLARALVLGSLPVSIIGLVERGERFFSFGDGLNLVRSASTLKNAAFLGAYLALVVPIAVRLALDATANVGWRVVAAVAAAGRTGHARVQPDTRRVAGHVGRPGPARSGRAAGPRPAGTGPARRRRRRHRGDRRHRCGGTVA